MATELEKKGTTDFSQKEKAGGGSFFQKLFGEAGGLFGKSAGPALDVIDRANELLVRADIPGLDEQDVTVEVDGRTLTIWGERHEEREERDESYYYAERWEGSFKRTIELPEEVDPTRASAHFDAGVLEVCFPKTAPKKTGRRIEVTGPSASSRPTSSAQSSRTEPYGESTELGASSPYRGSSEPASSSTARRVEVTGSPSSTEPEEEPRIVSPPHSPADDLGRH